MASRKRAASPPPDGPRKSSRKSVAPARFGFEPEPFEPHEESIIPPVDLPNIEGFVGPRCQGWYNLTVKTESDLLRYGTLLEFLATKETGRHEWQHARIQKARDKVRKRFLQYIEELKTLYGEIDGGTSNLEIMISWEDHWYDNGNLLALDLDNLCRLLERNSIKDAKHFQQYLIRSLPEYLRNGYKDYYNTGEERLRKKLLRLEKALREADQSPAERCFQLCASWCAAIAVHDSGKLRGLCEDMRKRASKNYNRPRNDPTGEPSTYWDTAAAYRSLLVSFRALKCREPQHLPRGWALDTTCYHFGAQLQLEKMWDDAHAEISGRVHLAVGDALPAELADLVLHFALEAEELTPENRFKFYDKKQKKTIDTGRDLECGITRARNKWSVDSDGSDDLSDTS